MITLFLMLFLGVSEAHAGGWAVEAPLPDSHQEARATELFAEFRCVVCQSESIKDSQADLAKDMRGLIRDQIAKGKTDEEIRNYLVRSYGDYILTTPPLLMETWALWAAPTLLVLLGIAAIIIICRKSAKKSL